MVLLMDRVGGHIVTVPVFPTMTIVVLALL